MGKKVDVSICIAISILKVIFSLTIKGVTEIKLLCA